MFFNRVVFLFEIDSRVLRLYRGPRSDREDPDKNPIAIAVILQPRERTMTDEEIEALASKIVGEVQKRTGGALRG